jgi:tetratricopeptide (TPR) repeat protein
MMSFIVSPLIVIMLLLSAMFANGQDVTAGRSAGDSCEKEAMGISAEDNLDNAIEGLRERVKSNPSLVECRIRLGFLLLKKGSNDEAMKEFEAALQRMPWSYSAKTGKGIALTQKGDLKAAEIILKDALILNPDPVKVHYELGLVYERMGNLEKALSEYKEGINKYEKGRK